MSIEVESFGLTGMVGPGSNDLLLLKEPPTTGVNGDYDIALDPINGPAQRLDIDFGVTHLDGSGNTAAIALDLPYSDVKEVVNNYAGYGATGVIWLRAVYNY